MPWCQKCRTEYIEGIKTCNDCESELVDELEPQAEPQYDKEAYLTSAGGSIEADLLEALLTSNDIPVLKKYRDAGDYMNIYMGGTIYTIDIYVPSRLLEKAQDIIRNMKEAGEELQDCNCAEPADGKEVDEASDAADNKASDEVDEASDAADNKASDGANDKVNNEETGSIETAMEADNAATGSNEDQSALAAAETGYNRKRRIHTWIILLLFIPGLIWILVLLALNLFDWVGE